MCSLVDLSGSYGDSRVLVTFCFFGVMASRQYQRPRFAAEAPPEATPQGSWAATAAQLAGGLCFESVSWMKGVGVEVFGSQDSLSFLG